MLCPYCDADNIDGADLCDQCQMPLSHLHLLTPATQVERSLIKDRIRVLRPKSPITVASSTPVRDVLRILVDKSIGCVIVAEGNRPVGIFSERDALLKLNSDAKQLGDQPVSQFMTPQPETLDAAAKIAFAAHRMDQGGYRHLPIVADDGQLSGIISVRDILRYLTEKMTSS